MTNTNYEKLKQMYSRAGIGSSKQFCDLIDEIAEEEIATQKKSYN